MRLRDEALRIWKAGVEAVKPDRLIRRWVRRDEDRLVIGEREFLLSSLKRIVVVGAGKAGTAQAAALEDVLGDALLEALDIQGWVNVPADCVRPLRRIHLHPARPAGANEPTEAGVEGAEQILKLVRACTTDDLVICLISGGGSALLPCPAKGITLADKQAVTRFLSAAGANIRELNAVRKRLSRIKGGGLARACRAGTLISLIISDVIGDPIETIASGPTVTDTGTYQDAVAVLEKYGARAPDVPQTVLDFLKAESDKESLAQPSRSFADEDTDKPTTLKKPSVFHYVIGNNAVALSAAQQEAEQIGYHAVNLSSDMEGYAADVGRMMAALARGVRDTGQPSPPPACILSGGEPVVNLVPESERGRGGRNQELVLAAVETLWDIDPERIVILSGGTDGEDGPTDAAGAVADADLIREAQRRGLHPRPFLARNDSYTFFQALSGLIQTGPTHTNVMDLRVVLIAADE